MGCGRCTLGASFCPAIALLLWKLGCDPMGAASSARSPTVWTTVWNWHCDGRALTCNRRRASATLPGLPCQRPACRTAPALLQAAAATGTATPPLSTARAVSGIPAPLRSARLATGPCKRLPLMAAWVVPDVRAMSSLCLPSLTLQMPFSLLPYRLANDVQPALAAVCTRMSSGPRRGERMLALLIHGLFCFD